MKNLKNLLYLIIFGLGITSCAPRFYAPDTHNVPLLSGKGETNISASGNTERIEFQASHGLTNNIGIKANGGFFLPADFVEGEGGSGKMIELGAGYYTPLKGKWIFETYGIVGIGSAENHHPFNAGGLFDIRGELTTKFLRLGIQPNIGFKSEDLFFSFSTRLANLSFNNIAGDLVFEGEDQREYLMRNNSHFLIEPALSIRVIFNKFSVGMQLGYSGNVTKTNFRQYKSYAVLTLHYTFNSQYSDD